MSTMNPVRKSVLMIILFVFVFASFALLACDDGPSPSCDNVLVPCPADAILGEKNPIENAVENFVCDDGTCDNTLSGGN